MGAMPPISTLDCACGLRLRLPGARPGRVGRCPRCGDMIRVPDVRDGAGTAVDRATEDGSERRTASREERSADWPTTRRDAGAVAIDHGPIRAPKGLERNFLASLAYPLWSWSSVGVLASMPPLLVVSTGMILFAMSLFEGNLLFRLVGLVMMIPMVAAAVAISGYALLFVGEVLTSTSRGEVLPPRTPGVAEGEVARTLIRWIVALLFGVGLGAVPAVAYWIRCGEVDPVDWMMITNLASLGTAYAQLALVSALMHDDPLAANPITVGRAFGRVGFEYAGICLLSGGSVVGAIWLFHRILEVDQTVPFLGLLFVYWGIVLYWGMVVARRVGLYFRRRKVVDLWFGAGRKREPRPDESIRTAQMPHDY